MEDQFSVNNLPEEIKKYVPSALKQYAEIKKIDDPNAEVRRIMKNFEGGKSVDT